MSDWAGVSSSVSKGEPYIIIKTPTNHPAKAVSKTCPVIPSESKTAFALFRIRFTSSHNYWSLGAATHDVFTLTLHPLSRRRATGLTLGDAAHPGGVGMNLVSHAFDLTFRGMTTAIQLRQVFLTV